jgi:U3 small nucleolar RNA-associated protein 14
MTDAEITYSDDLRTTHKTSSTTVPSAPADPAENAWLSVPSAKQSKKGSDNRIDKIQKKRKRDEAENTGEKVNIDTSLDTIHEALASVAEAQEEEDAPTMTYGRGRVAFKQSELLQKAFAADAFEQDFIAEKEAANEEDAPKEEDLTLPGWGSWTGVGVKRRATEKTLIKKIPGVDASKRKDAKLKNVIINEKRVKNVCNHHLTCVYW